MESLFLITVVIFFLGVFFIGLSGGIFRWRALNNKKAWEGSVIPLLIVGVPITIIGLILCT
ncbi:Uncharacterised protein [Listeria fleischmannii subsp. fleischmannii]|uniref:Uncharacterized protein n=1 Tax=Listeria fleischmannii subsp. fleischmannii TaxID=1671902 RepID=A0A2X3HIV0_9LIST|nr:Uncharacterised protein [Listeria fleischmannii subsp. fleischmannii]